MIVQLATFLRLEPDAQRFSFSALRREPHRSTKSSKNIFVLRHSSPVCDAVREFAIDYCSCVLADTATEVTTT